MTSRCGTYCMHFIYHTHLTSSFHRYIWQDELKDYIEQYAMEKARRLRDPEQAAKDKNKAKKKDKDKEKEEEEVEVEEEVGREEFEGHQGAPLR
jgi:hypothetical protein